MICFYCIRDHFKKIPPYGSFRHFRKYGICRSIFLPVRHDNPAPGHSPCPHCPRRSPGPFCPARRSLGPARPPRDGT